MLTFTGPTWTSATYLTFIASAHLQCLSLDQPVYKYIHFNRKTHAEQHNDTKPDVVCMSVQSFHSGCHNIPVFRLTVCLHSYSEVEAWSLVRMISKGPLAYNSKGSRAPLGLP